MTSQPTPRELIKRLPVQLLESDHPARYAVGLLGNGVLALFILLCMADVVARHPLVSRVYFSCSVAFAAVGLTLVLAMRRRAGQQSRCAVDRRTFAAHLQRRLASRRWRSDARREDDHRRGGILLLNEVQAALRGADGELDHAAVLSAVGALAGFACLMSVHSQRKGDLSALAVRGPDGALYYFGDPITDLLCRDDASVLAMAAQASSGLYPEELPDIPALGRHVIGSIGTRAFGDPRLPPLFKPAPSPVEYARASLDVVLAISMRYARSPDAYWRIATWAVFGASLDSRYFVSSRMALKIIMESAVPCSCIDPQRIFSVDGDAGVARQAAARIQTLLASVA